MVLHKFIKYYLKNKGPKPEGFPEHYDILDNHYKNLGNYEIIHAFKYLDKDYKICQKDIGKLGKDNRKILIFAGVHGDEVSGLKALEGLNFPKGFFVRVISPVNPVGIAYGTRYNKDGRDINRDFKNFKTREARIQRDALMIFQPDLVISLHEGPQSGNFLICNKIDLNDINRIVNNMKKNDVKFAKKSFLNLKVRDATMKMDYSVIIPMKIFKIYTLGAYCNNRDMSMITVEVSSKDSYRKRVDTQRKILKSIIE